MRRSVLIIIALVLAAASANAQVVGRSAALGSDTLMLNGQIFQLYGIDGIVFDQFCFVDGEPWACGASATRALQSLVDPVVLTCTPTGETNGEAIYAVCTSNDGDIGQLMVEQGWALANRTQSGDYVAAEEESRAAGNGIWRGVVVDPSDYRADMAAIAERYSALVAEPLRADAEQALAQEGTTTGVFADVTVRTVAADDPSTTTETDVTVAGVGADFFSEAIPARDVFSWATVAEALNRWRQDTIKSLRESVVDAVQASLIAHANQVVEVQDADTYYAALNAGAAAWLDQGRHPVLFITDPGSPRWVADWLDGQLPQGGSLTHRTDIAAANYLGTINGIDVYAGPTPGTTSLLTVDDLLVSLTYRLNSDGKLLQLIDDRAANRLTFSYALGIAWKDDPVVWLHYPPAEGVNPYAN